MKKEFWSSSKGRILTALMVNIIILVLYCFFVDLRYESNDDFSIAYQVGTKGILHVGYVNYYLCGLISFIQSNLFPTMNIFILSQIVLSFLSFVVLSYVFLDSKRNWYLYGLGLLVLMVFAYDHYSLVQFTKTSGLLVVTGTIIIVHTFLHQSTKWCAVFGVFWIILGTGLRYSNLKAIIGLSLVLLVALLLTDLKQNKFLKPALGIFISIVIAVTGSYIFDELSMVENYSTDELKKYREYNKYRSNMSDYAIPDYTENKLYYDSYGLSENDLLVIKYYHLLDYDGAASIDNLKAISAKQKEKNTDKRTFIEAILSYGTTVAVSISNMEPRAVHAMLILLLLIFGTAALDKRWLKYALIIVVGGVFAYIYLFYMGRAPYRATYIIDFAVVSFLLYHMRTAPRRKWFKQTGETNKHSVPLVIAIVMILISMQSIYVMEKSILFEDRGGYDANKLWSYMNEQGSLFFILDVETATNYYQMSFDYYNNPLLAEPSLKSDNKTAFGGWSTMSPGRLKTLNRHGLDNLFLDIIDNENIIVVGDGSGDFYYRIEEYFNEQYGTDGLAVVFVPYGTVGGFSLWQVKYQEY